MTDMETKEKEFEKALGEYNGIITKVCYYFSNDSDEFKDLRQEVLYNIWKGWDKFRKDSKISTWIYRVSFNTCISFQRKEKKHSLSLSIDNLINLPDDSRESLLEKYNMMYSLIRSLKYDERALLLLWLDEKSYEEIFELMGLNRNTVAVKLKRVKEKLIKMNQENR